MKTAKAAKKFDVFRVYRLPNDLRGAVAEAREASQLTTRAWLDKIIGEELPKLVEQILGLGISPTRGKKLRPMRLPLNDKIGDLQAASLACGLDGSLLLLTCLNRAVARSICEPKVKPAGERLARHAKARKTAKATRAKQPKTAAAKA